MRIRALCLPLLLAILPCQAQTEPWQVESGIHGVFLRASVAKEAGPAFLGVFRDLEASLAAHPEREPLAYLCLQALELAHLYGPLPGAPALATEAEMLWKRFPHSARIAVLRARALGTLEAAQASVEVDGTFLPAHLERARALLASGNTAAAQAEVRSIAGYATHPQARLLLAQALLAEGAAGAAVKEAQQALRLQVVPCLDAFHPSPYYEGHATLGMAYLKLGRSKDAARHLRMAAPGSAAARGILADPGLEHSVFPCASMRQNKIHKVLP